MNDVYLNVGDSAPFDGFLITEDRYIHLLNTEVKND